jgi:glutamate receptor, ionotropic, plant
MQQQAETMGYCSSYTSSSRPVVPSSSLRRLGLVLAAALLVWCQRVATAQQPVPVPVRVGVILNLTPSSPVGQRRKLGIEMAVEDYYAARPGSRTRVALRFRDSAGDVVGATSAGNYIQYNKPDGCDRFTGVSHVPTSGNGNN